MTAPPVRNSSHEVHTLLGYVADLELEVDRLRKQDAFIRQELGDGLRRLLGKYNTDSAAGSTEAQAVPAVRELLAVLSDLRDPAGYHPAHDQVVAVAVRPLVEQVFRWQQRLSRCPNVALRLELEIDHVEWFPVRLRHILDNLFSNAVRNRDPAKAEPWVFMGLKLSESGYQIRISDNGVGMPGEDRWRFALLSRAAPLREAGLGVGLSVVQILVEQSGGTLKVRSENGRGTDFDLTLPRYDVDDYLE